MKAGHKGRPYDDHAFNQRSLMQYRRKVWIVL